MRYRVLPYKQGSKSAKALATALGGKVLKLEGSTFKPKADDVIINWGNGNGYESEEVSESLINCPCAIRNASNKLKFFELMKEQGCGDYIPAFWTNPEEIPDAWFPVVCRTILSGHSGAGIVIAASRDDLVPAPLYVTYLKKKDEYRVHLGRLPSGDCSTISLQRKARRLECPDPNWQVRNHANGFVYVRNEVNPPECVLEAAEACFLATGLDFGAVDVIYNQYNDAAYVLEVNTAPGLEGSTVNDYATFFKNFSSTEEFT